jgi:DNA-binding response OmpR family regulator
MGGSEGQILIVEDDAKIRGILRDYLSSEGFDVSEAADASALRRRFPSSSADLILLDIGLPGTDGLSLAREIRRQSDIAIIMLSGRADVVDRVVGIEMGADDYIVKPFHLREVLARVRAVLRRVRAGEASAVIGPKETVRAEGFAFGGWKLIASRRCLVNPEGDDVDLTSGEYEMLWVLLQNAGRVLSRDQLMDLTRGRGWAAMDRAIDAQIVRLRKKIEPDTRHPVFIKSVRGIGYVFSGKVSSLT